ncbi:hypothetical protein [Xenorhabdus bovienii]|uniref:hypothetical protein n=1 Tax=Xenorhabdus bovienii TaxID=40576 RepID=UPI003DA2BC76
MSEQELIQFLSEISLWVGLLLLSPFLWKFSYAFTYYLTGKLKKKSIIIIQRKHNGIVIDERIINLASTSPIVEQLDEIKKKQGKNAG